MRLLACLFLALLTLAASCDPPEDVPTPSPSTAALPSPSPTVVTRTLRHALAEPMSIVPPEAAGREAATVVDALFDSLTTYDEDLDVVPAAASRWTSNAEATVWLFTLRQGALFHDESPVTADDFAFAWHLAMSRPDVAFHLRDVAGWREVREGGAASLRGLRVIDDASLEVTLTRGNADFPAIVGHPALGPVNRRLWQEDPEAQREQPSGNGPFQAAQRSRGRFLRVTRFEKWRNGQGPNVDEVLFRFLAPDAGYVAFQQGTVDVAELPDGSLDEARAHPAATVVDGPTPNLYYLGMNTHAPPFDDPEVRRALSLAIDRERLTTELLEGNADPATAITSPVLPGAADDPCGGCVYDPTGARRVFRARDIDVLTLSFSEGGGHDHVAGLIRQDLSAAGVRLRLDSQPFAEYLQALTAGEPQLFRFGWAPEYPTLEAVLTPLIRSAEKPGEDGSRNYGRFLDDLVDARMDQARTTLSPALRARRYNAAERMALDAQAIVPLFTYRLRTVVSERVSGVRVDPLGRVHLEDAQVVDPRPTPSG